ncbi:MAG TPA: HU family DNA-binding protein [Actinobacteria bacterium]|nr:HU family DNA-binding protein [Actinomycetota bacterium]
MRKRELVEVVAARVGVDDATVAAVVDAALETIVEEVAAGGEVRLHGFGVFESRDRRPRPARNLQTGATIRLPATRVPFFRAGRVFKEAVRHR